MKNDRIINTKFIDILDGIRAISIIIVLIFHFWQQTWIWPTIETPFLSFLGISRITLNSYARVGYLFVDMMVLLSGFLLFLPLARQVLMGESLSSWKQYAKKRVARIIPSYLFCVIALFVYELSKGGYANAGLAIQDLLTHITFTQTLTMYSYFSTNLNVVLWTVAVEVWFYILFPFIAEFIKRRGASEGEDKNSIIVSIFKMLLVAAVMYAIAEIYMRKVVFREGIYVAMFINQLPAFLGAYANGMIGAFILVLIAKKVERTHLISYISLAVAVLCVFAIDWLVKDCASLTTGDESRYWQVTERFKLTGVFTLLIISLALSPKWIRWLFSNKLMRFLSIISYNLYIWHQWLAVELKYSWRIPNWVGETPPNQSGDMEWMWQYAIVITVAAFVIAIITTYLVEKPCSNLLLGKPAFGKKKDA